MRRLTWVVLALALASAARSQQGVAAGGDWTPLFESYIAWDAGGRGRAVPWRGVPLPSPAQIEALVREPPRDPRQAFGFALFLLGHHRDADAHRLIERIASDRNAPARARTLWGCLLLAQGHPREALAQWDASSADETCGLTSLVHDRTPLRFMKAIALHQSGRGDEAMRLLSEGGGLGTESAACLLGDLQELDGHPEAALSLWQGGACQERMAEHRAASEPFEVLRASWGTGGEGTRASAIVAAAWLGALDLAREGLEHLAAQCEQPTGWTSDCLRLPLLRRRVGPLAESGSPRPAALLAPFTLRSASANRLAPHDPDTEEIGWIDDPPEALDEWDVVRIQRDASLAVAVSAGLAPRIGQSPDPFPLYRLHVSRDGGAHYDAPIVLGLIPGCPAVVRSQSRIPLLSGSNVQLEVLRSRPRADSDRLDPALIVAPLDALTRDADGDGLSDALEHAWRLDPSRADTDGDGEPDGSDTSPRVPPGWSRPELDGFLEYLAVTDLSAPQGVEAKDLPARPSPALTAAAAPSPQGSMRAVFLRPPAVAAGTRVLALSADEADACGALAAEWTGMVFGRLDVVFDQDGSRALLRWSGSHGGSAWLAQRGTAWTLHPIVSWMH